MVARQEMRVPVNLDERQLGDSQNVAGLRKFTGTSGGAVFGPNAPFKGFMKSVQSNVLHLQVENGAHRSVVGREPSRMLLFAVP